MRVSRRDSGYITSLIPERQPLTISLAVALMQVAAAFQGGAEALTQTATQMQPEFCTLSAHFESVLESG